MIGFRFPIRVSIALTGSLAVLYEVIQHYSLFYNSIPISTNIHTHILIPIADILNHSSLSGIREQFTNTTGQHFKHSQYFV